ncbi:hypothetical protein F4777DRAFT_164864 [Nemania sp. FL0916]|nr:hypothetical protein F4777DRAFT_164864 [Nemania sp. FL0916]
MSPSESTPTSAVPIALVGRHDEVGSSVAEALRPEYEVTHFMSTETAVITDLPYLLRGESPPSRPHNENNTVGSGATANRPVQAVIFGRGFTQEQTSVLYDEFVHISPKCLWVVGDAKNRGEGDGPPPNLAEIIVPVFKGLLKDGVGKDGGMVYY